MSSKEAERHLALMIKAIKLGLAGHPLYDRPRLSPEVLECLRDGDWEGVAIGHIHDQIEGRPYRLGKQAIRHFCDWADTPDVNRSRLVQDLIVRFNQAAPKHTARLQYALREPNRAEKRAAKRRGGVR